MRRHSHPYRGLGSHLPFGGPSRALLIAAILLVSLASAAWSQDRGLSVQGRQITGNPGFEIGKQYAVIIGIDRYKEWTSLRNAVSEAKAVKSILAERYYIDEFIELYDTQATAAGLRKLFVDDLPKRLTKDDSLFLFYAGHGFLDASQTGFWIASDGVKDQYDQRGWIANQQIRNYLSQLKAQRILVVADACFSGDFLNVARGAGPTVDSAYFAKALQLQARQVLTSGASETVPDESEFGRYFITTLERNADPILDPHSMYDRIRTNVQKTVPLLGTIPGNEAGATFAFFLRPSFGSLSVETASAANIEIDGKGLGASSPGKPFSMKELAAGVHELRIVYQGAEERRSVLIRAGEANVERFEWRAARTGSLAISAQADATVLIDGKPVGSIAAGTTLTLSGILEGERTIALQYSDNQETRKLIVYPDSANAASFAYAQESFAIVNFVGFPDGALVYSSGRELGTVAAGRFTARNLVPGQRSFSVFYERWAEPYQLNVEANAKAPATAAFQGGFIVVRSVPRNVQVAVDGKVILKADGLRDSYDLGAFPVGAHSISLTGDNWEAQRLEVLVRPGAESAVSASMAMRPGSSASAPKAGAATGSLAGFGGLRVKYQWGQADEVEVRLVKEGDDEDFPVKLDQVNLYSAGAYVLNARMQDDPEWTFSQKVAIASGTEQSITMPPMERSIAWKIADAMDQRWEASTRLSAAQSKRKSRAATANLGVAVGLAGLGFAGYGIYDGLKAYPEYQAAATPALAVELRQRMVLDQNYLVFGLAGSGVSFILSAILRGNNSELRSLQDTLDELDRMLEDLRRQQ